MDLSEARPVCVASSPAFKHYVMDVFVRGEPGQTLELSIVTMESCQVLHYFGIRQLLIRLPSAECEDLPQCDGEGPDVTFRCVPEANSILVH
ncbi:unnamed protein product [Acanthoscelides obtectus]|uniref:Uncharacterized protein n=1 Tax=Acanthoscelides obtectus TaxID=200917 RepID=A0A9P0L7J3_ACAOB|nr:unnamed protein product [Acanthoscelides obtectus]CAK1674541.1 hypothetical protein AOBTE_LOCUS29651 [Acanthoscelides obtectus]